MVMLNDLDRFHLVMDVIDRVPRPRRACGGRAPADGRRAAAPSRLHARARRRPAGRARLDLARRGVRARGAGARRPGITPDVRVLVVNAGSSSLKLSLLDADDSELWSSELAAPRAVVEADAVAAALAELPRRPDVAGHRIVHGGERFREAVGRRRARRGRAPRADRARAASPAEVAGRARRGRDGAAERPGGRVLRHRLPRHAPAGGRHLRASARVARALRRAPLRLPRPLARLRLRGAAG